ETIEGEQLRVVVSFTDTNSNADSGTLAAGTVQESSTEVAAISLSGRTSSNAVEGQQVTATVTEADAPASSQITYTWKVNGTTVASGLATRRSSDLETIEGEQLRVVVSFTDTNSNADSGTLAAGTVQESPTEVAAI